MMINRLLRQLRFLLLALLALPLIPALAGLLLQRLEPLAILVIAITLFAGAYLAWQRRFPKREVTRRLGAAERTPILPRND